MLTGTRVVVLWSSCLENGLEDGIGLTGSWSSYWWFVLNLCWSNLWFCVMTLNLTEWSLIKGPWKCDVDGDVLWVWCLESDSSGWLQCSPEHWTPAVSDCDWTFTVTISAILGQGESVVSVKQTWWTSRLSAAESPTRRDVSFPIRAL